MSIRMSIRTEWTPEHIKALRDRMGLTQYDLASRVGVREATLNRWENAHAKPQRAFAKALDALAAAELAKVAE